MLACYNFYYFPYICNCLLKERSVKDILLSEKNHGYLINFLLLHLDCTFCVI